LESSKSTNPIILQALPHHPCTAWKAQICQAHHFASTSPTTIGQLGKLESTKTIILQVHFPTTPAQVGKPKPAKVHAFYECFSNLQSLESLNMPKHMVIASAFPGSTDIAS
jgi:hypothetical protein